jgi:hypothetical protein
MNLKKVIKHLINMFFLFFLFSCSSNNISIEKTPTEIIITEDIPQIDCKETLDVNCIEHPSNNETNMQNKSIEKIDNNKTKSPTTSTKVKRFKNPIYKVRAEKHCKEYNTKAILVSIDNWKRTYREKYLCIK